MSVLCSSKSDDELQTEVCWQAYLQDKFNLIKFIIVWF